MNALSFRGVRFGYDANPPVLAGLSWSIREGTMSGIVGPNGSGKTTLFRLATGILTPSEGTVELAGRGVQELSALQIARSVALVPQMESVVFPYPVRQMVGFGRFAYESGPGYFRKSDTEKVDWAMELCGISPLADRPVTELSGGELHRVLFARALAQDTPVLLLDEPTAFMDIRYQVTLFDLLLRMRDEFGKTIVCVTHDLNVAMTYFDDVAVLNHSVVAAQGEPGAILNAENLERYFEIRVTVHEVGSAASRVIQIHSPYRADSSFAAPNHSVNKPSTS